MPNHLGSFAATSENFARNVRSSVSRSLMLCLAILAAQAAMIGDAIAQKRLALVVATSNYDHLRPSAIRLDTIKRVSEALRRQGFEVTTSFEQNNAQIRAELNKFHKKISDNDFALVVLAGHSVSKERNSMIFLPKEVRVGVNSDRDILLRGISTVDLAGIVVKAKRSLVLWMNSDPNLPAQFKWASPYPRPIRLEQAKMTVAFSGSSKAPISQLDRIAQFAADRLAAVTDKPFDDARQLVAAVADRKYGLVLGGEKDIKLPPIIKPVPVTNPDNSSALARQLELLEADRRSQRAAREKAERRAKAARDRAREAERKARDADARAQQALDDMRPSATLSASRQPNLSALKN